MKAEIITLLKYRRTTEFFSGEDYVKKELRLIGTEIYSYPQMNENLVLDSDILNSALSRSDIVIIMSPIDTLSDDRIKVFLSKQFSLPLERDLKTMERIEEAFKRNRLDVPPSSESLSYFPKGAVVFANERGIQSGYGIVVNGKIIICVPDDSFQQRQMYDDYIFSFLSCFSNVYIEERTVGIYGLTGAYVKAQLSLKLKSSDNCIISIKEGEDDALIRVVCVAKDEKRVKEHSYKVVKKIAEMFSDYVYGIDIKNNMQAAVNEILCKDIELSFADGYTRGVLSRRFKEAIGFKEAFIGYTVLDTSSNSLIDEGVSPSLIEKHGIVSDEVATALAYSNLCFNHSDIAVGIVGYSPKNGKQGKVIVSICDENQCQIHNIDIKDNGLSKDAEDIASDKIINIIRVFAKEYPQFKNSKNIKLFMGEFIRDTYTKREKTTDKKSKEEKVKKSHQKNLDYKGIYAYKQQDNQGGLEISTPKKESKFKKFLLWFMLTICVLSLVGSIGYILYYYQSSGSTKDYYAELADLHISENLAPESIKVPDGYPKNYDKRFIPLWEKNKDVAGWLKIETLGGKEIVNYPVVQREGDKNQYYDRKDFSKNYSRYGVPFVDYECDLKIPSDNIIIYGHNMKDGQMFGCFENYVNIDYFKKHPVISFDSVYKPGDYAIFGVFYASTLPEDNPFNYHCFTMADTQEEYNSFVNEVKKRSLYNVPIEIEPGDELITLSTCVYKFPNGKEFKDGRFVLVGRKLREGETKEQVALEIKENKNPLMPTPYYRAETEKKIYPTSINIEQDAITLSVNKQQQLGVNILPKDASTEKIFWHSSDENVAQVYSGGLVKAIAPGNAVISVSNETGKVFDKVNVSVIPKTENSIEKLNILKDSVTLKRNDVFKIEYEYFPKDAKNVGVVFASDDAKIATVDDQGKITGIVAGRTKIKAFTPDGKYLDEIDVKVVPEYISVDSISISSPDLTLDIGKQVKLYLIIKPLNATNADIVWQSDNPDVATVSKDTGKVTAISEGSAKITAQTRDGDKSDFIYVDVRAIQNTIPVSSVSMTDKITLTLGATKNLYPKISPANASNKGIRYESSNNSVFTVSSNGNITAVGAGTATATVTTDDGGYKAHTTIVVTDVGENPESIKFDSSLVKINVGEKIKLTPLVYPQTAKNYEILYSSSNTDTVLIDQSGNITARASGKATITAQVKNTSLKATCTVEVTKPVDNTVLSAINLTPTSVSLEKGETANLSYTLEPSTALNKELVFTSQDKTVATVDNSGTIVAVGGGSTKIVVSAKEGTAKAVCSVTVKADEPLSLTISENDIKMKVDDVKKIVPEILPSSDGKEVIWSSSNDTVAKVSDGSIAAVKAGNATITAQIKGTEIKAICRVLVE